VDEMDNDNAWMKNYSLQQVEDAFHNGILTEKQVEDYLERWNATPGRLTRATFSGYNIYNT
jgi:hypothetical protein